MMMMMMMMMMMIMKVFMYTNICDAYHYSYTLHRRYSLSAYRYNYHDYVVVKINKEMRKTKLNLYHHSHHDRDHQIDHHHHSSHNNIIVTYLQSSRDNNNNNLDDLILDTNSLDESEQKRLKYLQQINADASGILRSSGINYIDNDNKSDDDDGMMFDKPVEDTQWTGQSTSERRMTSTRDYRDVIQRPFLAFLDFTALVIFAIIGK